MEYHTVNTSHLNYTLTTMKEILSDKWNQNIDFLIKGETGFYDEPLPFSVTKESCSLKQQRPGTSHTPYQCSHWGLQCDKSYTENSKLLSSKSPKDTHQRQSVPMQPM